MFKNRCKKIQQSFDVFVPSVTFCLRNAMGIKEPKIPVPPLLSPSSSDSRRSEAAVPPCPGPPSGTHRPAEPPPGTRWGRWGPRRPSRELVLCHRDGSVTHEAARKRAAGAAVPQTSARLLHGAPSVRPDRPQRWPWGASSPGPLSMAPRHPLPRPARPSRSLFPPSPSRFLSGRRRFGPATPPSPSGCGERHGGGSLNVSGSEAPCGEEWGRRGPPVAGQVTGTAGAPPAGRAAPPQSGARRRWPAGAAVLPRRLTRA